MTQSHQNVYNVLYSLDRARRKLATIANLEAEVEQVIGATRALIRKQKLRPYNKKKAA